MTESQAATMVKDMVRDCIEEADPVPGGDTSYGSMLIEGACSEFHDIDPPVPLPHCAFFSFRQGRFRYTVGILAERLP
jgi:hypothetical protein